MFLFVEQLCLYCFVKALQIHLLNTLFMYVSYILVLIKLPSRSSDSVHTAL